METWLAKMREVWQHAAEMSDVMLLFLFAMVAGAVVAALAWFGRSLGEESSRDDVAATEPDEQTAAESRGEVQPVAAIGRQPDVMTELIVLFAALPFVALWGVAAGAGGLDRAGFWTGCALTAVVAVGVFYRRKRARLR